MEGEREEGREKEGGREGGRRQREAGGERGKGLREGEREGERYEKENGSGRRVKGREIENEEKWSINYAKSTNRHILTIMYIAPDGITGFSPGTFFNPLYTRQAFSCIKTV